jgi:hypothetical protein
MDASMLVALLNTINLLGNIFWTLKLKAIQGHKEILDDLTQQNRAKDVIIRSLKDERRQLRFQYNQTLADNHKYKGELDTYKKFNNHIPLA